MLQGTLCGTSSPLEKIYYRGERYQVDEDLEEQDEVVPDDWQYQVKNYGIGDRESEHYCDVVNSRWSYLD